MGLAQHFSARGEEAAAAGNEAVAVLGAIVRREAYVKGYGDCFFLMDVVMLIMIVPVWLSRPAQGVANLGH
jgi:hypothetical protein